MLTFDVLSCAYGIDELQPGSSMNTAVTPGVIQFLKSITCSSLFTASPGARSCASIAWVMSFSNGANSPVTRPGAGRPHAHETRPEQSDRYGSQAGFEVRLQVAEHEAS